MARHGGVWVPHRTEIIKVFASGDANMGNVEDETAVARFGSRTARWVFLYLRVHFHSIDDSATGTASLKLKLDSHRLGDTDHDVDLWPAGVLAGVGSDVNHWIEPLDFHAWTFEPNDFISLDWTNPDTGDPDSTKDMRWGMEAGYVEVETEP